MSCAVTTPPPCLSRSLSVPPGRRTAASRRRGGASPRQDGPLVAAGRAAAGNAARTRTPPGRRPGATGTPAMVGSRRSRGPPTRGTESSRPQVYGCRGPWNTARRGPSSAARPPYMTRTRSAIWETTPMSWVMSTIAEPRSVELPHQVEDLRLDRDVERGRRLVGDQQRGAAGERHRDDRALPHPAGELVRVGVHPRGRRRGCRRPRAAGPPARAPPSGRPVRAPGSARRSASRRVYTGVSAVIGSWKTIAISRPRTARISLSGRVSRSRPRKRTSPDTVTFGLVSSRSTASIDTLLPEPDSPTTPRTSPGATEKERPSTAVTRPWRVRKRTRRSRTSEQRFRHGGPSDRVARTGCPPGRWRGPRRTPRTGPCP